MLEAFAKYWFSVLSYAYETGDVTTVQANESVQCLSAPFVKGYVNDIRTALILNGQWMAGGKIDIASRNRTVHQTVIYAGHRPGPAEST